MTSRTARTRRGAAIAWVVIVLMVLLAFLGLAIDVGYAYYTGQKLQVAADAAALAGAHQIWEGHTGARAAAIEIAAANHAGGAEVQLADNPDNEASGDVVLGTYDAAARTFTPSIEANSTNAVMVRARRTEGSLGGPLPLFFGPLFNNASLELTRWAIAVAEGGPAESDLIALNPSDPQSFYIYGNGHLDLGDGTAQVNSTNNKGALFQGNDITYVFGETDVTGGYDDRGNPSIEWEDINEGEPAISDPLANLPEPSISDYTRYTTITGGSAASPMHFQPGYYPGGLDLKAGNNVFLHPGVYILDNGFTTNGHSTLNAQGVMFFLRTGGVKDNGTGQAYVTPPTSGTYAGVQFFQARDNTAMATFNGGTIWNGSLTDDPATPDVNEATAGTGTLYFPNATLELGGSGTMYVDGLIADKVVVYGTGEKHVTGGWDGDEGTTAVYIVE